VWPYTMAQRLKCKNSLILLHHFTAMAYLVHFASHCEEEKLEYMVSHFMFSP
jgi:hypothetical protein